jgi:hypothetical protein
LTLSFALGLVLDADKLSLLLLIIEKLSSGITLDIIN